MTFLPIVDRELRVAARRQATYWMRVGVALGALVVAGIAALVAVLEPTVRFGPICVQTVSGMAMLYCLGAGRTLTADSLSIEKREETMGLLFLTDLKGFDVVLGKMAATSLNGLYALLALLPVLALTLLTGGVTNGEFWRVALVLVETFFFSLSVGIFASALTREFRAAMAANFYLVLGLIGATPALAGLLLFFHRTPIPDLFVPCPIFTLFLAFDAPYRGMRMEFWSSAAFVFSMALLLTGLACRIAPQSWQHKAVTRVKKKSRIRAVFRARAELFRRHMLDRNAYLWLAARPWWKAHAVWALLGAGILWLAIMGISVGWLDEAVCYMVALTLNGAFKFWITHEAGQTLAEDMRTGAFELLLATPLTTRDIVAGQALALRRQFLKPLLVLGVLEIFFMVMLMSAHPSVRASQFWFWTAVIIILAADVVALSLMAMTSALTEKNITRALSKAVSRVVVLPWIFWGVVMAVEKAYALLFGDPDASTWGFGLASWFGISLWMDAYFAVRAWRRLTLHFREMALKRYGDVTVRTSLRARLAELRRAFRDYIWSRPRPRKWAISLVALVALGFSLEVWDSNRSHDPPPEIVLTGPDIGVKFQAVPASDGVFFILPDGSLWRWGLTDGTNRSRLPEQIGTNRAWSMIRAENRGQRLAVRQDGTLWQWAGTNEPLQVGTDTDWAEAVGGTLYKVARKKDGTLWAWGDVNMGAAPSTTAPVWLPSPPAREHDWKVQYPPTRIMPRRGRAVGVQYQATIFATNVVVARVGSNGVPGPTPVTAPPMNFARSNAIYLARNNTTFAMDADGTLWVWGMVRLRQSGTIATNYYADPIQVCRETNWVGMNAGMPQTKDGSLWSFFNAPPDPTAPASAIGMPYRTLLPIPLGTNHDWTAVEVRQNTFFALRANGALYGWGQGYNPAIGTFVGVPGPLFSARAPVQICAETDWVGFDRSFGYPYPFARNQAGQLWEPATGGNPAITPSAPISSTGKLFAAFASSNQTIKPAQPFHGGAVRYEVHPDGTLGCRPAEFTGLAGSILIGPPQRADQRGDWVAVASAGSATFGLTADGTLWTWGLNLGERPKIRTQSRITAVSQQVQAALGSGPPTPPGGGPVPTYDFQEKPRALLKLIGPK